MRAVTLAAFTGPEAISVADVPDPEAGAEDVLVEVVAAALGPWDLGAAAGAFAGVGGLTEFPQIQGWDFAGIVRAGPQSGPAFGSTVMGFTPQPWSRTGAFAELIVVPPATVAPVPAGLDPVAAATVPVCALTADLMLRTGGAAAGQRVLVLGAGGAVGSLAVQLAAHGSLEVFGVADATDGDRVHGLGAAHVIERGPDVAALVRAIVPDGVDLLIDVVGGDAASAVLGAVRDGGRAVTSVPGPAASERDITVEGVQVQPDGDRLSILAALLGVGALTPPPIGVRFPLADAPAAYAALADRSISGKIVLVARS